jgi:hypothetical protein
VKRLRIDLRKDGHEVVVALYCIGYLVLLIGRLARGEGQTPAESALFFGIGFATVWSRWLVSRRTEDRRGRAAWGLLTLAGAVSLVGGLGWTAKLLGGIDPQTATEANWIDYLHYPAIVAGFMLFRHRGTALPRDTLARVDWLFVTFAFGLAWYLSFRSAVSIPEGVTASVVLFPIFDAVVVLTAWSALRAAPDEATRDAIGLTMVGQLVYLLTDYYWSLVPISYQPGHGLDVAWFVAWVSQWVGARRALRSLPAPTSTASMPGDHGRWLVVLALAAVTLLVMVATLDPPCHSAAPRGAGPERVGGEGGNPGRPVRGVGRLGSGPAIAHRD